MTTALVAISDMERMAQAFAKSGMFGAKTPDQALALLLLAQAEGQHPAIAMRDFDVIQGRPAKKSEAMLRSFLEAGGKVEWHKLDDTGAEATFSHPQGGTVRIDWDAARAKRAGLSNRDMYSKYSRQMYRSRVVSEGCRTVYPASTSGMYVPEEVRTFLKEDKSQPKDMGPAEVVKDAPDPEDEALKALEQANKDENPPPPQAPPQGMSTEPPKTRSDTLSELCLAAGVNKVKVLALADVKHPDEMSDSDWTDCVAELRRRITSKMVAETAQAQP